MNSRTLTAVLLIAGPLALFAGWFIFGLVVGNFDWGNGQEAIAKLAPESDSVKILISIAALGSIIIAAGYSGLNKAMSGGAGSHYANAGLLLFIIGTALVTIESTLVIGTADTAANGHLAVAGSLFAASQAIGGGGAAILFIGLALIGAGVFVQKNLQVWLGPIIIVVGIVGAVLSIIDYTADIMLIAYIGLMLTTLVTGVLSLRSED